MERAPFRDRIEFPGRRPARLGTGQPSPGCAKRSQKLGTTNPGNRDHRRRPPLRRRSRTPLHRRAQSGRSTRTHEVGNYRCQTTEKPRTKGPQPSIQRSQKRSRKKFQIVSRIQFVVIRVIRVKTLLPYIRTIRIQSSTSHTSTANFDKF